MNTKHNSRTCIICSHADPLISAQAIVTDVPTCGGATFARNQNAKVLVYPPKASQAQMQEDVQLLESEEELTKALRDDLQIDFVMLAGYLKLVPASTVAAFSRRMLNIHPSLLPAFGGKGMFGGKVHKAVIASGCRCVPWKLLFSSRDVCLQLFDCSRNRG